MINRIQPFIQDSDQLKQDLPSSTGAQVLHAIHLIESKSKDDQDRLFKSLQKLANDTAQHQAKLKWYREQLHLKLELNEELWKKKIQEMLDEFDRLKDELDERKLDMAQKKYEYNMKIKLFTLLEKRRTQKVLLRLKERVLRNRILTPIFGSFHRNQVGDNILQFTDNIRNKKLKTLALNQLATDGMRTVLAELQEKANSQNEEIITEYTDHPHDFGYCLAGQVGVLPFRPQKELSKIRAERPKKTYKPIQKKFRQPRKIIIEGQSIQPTIVPVEVFVQVEQPRKRTCRLHSHLTQHKEPSLQPASSRKITSHLTLNDEEPFSRQRLSSHKVTSQPIVPSKATGNGPEERTVLEGQFRKSTKKLSMWEVEDYLSQLEQENKRLKAEAEVLQRYR